VDLSDDKKPKLELEIEAPILEAPPPPESQLGNTVDALFSDESLAVVMAKVGALESFLNLASRNLDFHEFMREILLAVLRVVKCEAGSILEMDEKNKTLFFRTVVGQRSDRLADFVIPVGQGVAGYVAESRMPLTVNNVADNQVHLKSIERAVDFETRCLVAVPIVIRGRIFGVLELLNRLGGSFSTSDVEVLTYLCQMAAKCIEVRLMFAWALRKQEPQGGQGAAA
jgi:putative methionine-R-sulfoxide reductase with GAF domain